MKKLKKTLSLLLALTMCLSLVNLTALAADGDPWTDPSEFGSDQDVIPSKTPVENGTKTEWEYDVDAAPDSTDTPDVDESHGDIKVEGFETVTETDNTDEEGNVTGTTTTTEGSETITETTKEDPKVTEGEPERGEPEWNTEAEGTDEDGWKDVPPESPEPGPSDPVQPGEGEGEGDGEESDFDKVENPPVTPNEDLENGVTADLKDPNEDGTLTGSVVLESVDKDQLISEDVKDLTKDEETGTYTSTDGKTTATVTEGTDTDGKTTITVEKIETEDVEYGDAPEFGEDSIAVEVTVPEGAEAVYSEDGTTVIGYKTEVNTIDADGNSVTTTTTTMVTVIEKTAGGAVTQKRTVTTTTYTIDKADKTLDVELDGKLEGTEETTKSTDILDETAKNEVEEIAKKDNSTTTVTTNEDLDAIAKAGYDAVTEDLSKENAEAVINAVLLNKVNGTTDFVLPETWTNAQKALYEKLNAMDVTDSKTQTEEVTEEKPLPDEAAPDADPVETAAPSVDISNATVKVVDITTGEDSATNYKATVSFTVSTLPQVDGSLTLTLTDDKGNVFEQTVAKGNLIKNADGTYTVSVEVQLSGDAQNLKLNLTGSTTERTVYVVNAEVPETPGTPGGDTTPQDPIIFDKDKVDDTLNHGNFEAGNKNWEDAKGEDGKEYHASFSYNPKDGKTKFDTEDGAISDAQKAYLDKLVFESPEGNKCITIKAPADMDIPVGYIVVKGGNAMPVVYNVGTLKAGTSITVYAPPKEGGGYYGVSHVIFGDIDDPTEPTKPTPPTPGQSGTYVRVDEIQKKLDLSGKLDLTLNDILVGKKVETKDQVREGFATWNRQDKTEQVTIETVTVREWNRTEVTDNNEGEPPENPDPPEEIIPDPDVPTTEPDPDPTPTPEEPTVDIPDEEPPLVELPEEEPPVVDVPDEEPPLVDVPNEEPPVVDMPDEEPPLAELPEEPVPLAPAEPEVELPEEPVPLADVPQTGDISLVWYAAAAMSAMGLAVLTQKKREDEAN